MLRYESKPSLQYRSTDRHRPTTLRSTFLPLLCEAKWRSGATASRTRTWSPRQRLQQHIHRHLLRRRPRRPGPPCRHPYGGTKSRPADSLASTEEALSSRPHPRPPRAATRSQSLSLLQCFQYIRCSAAWTQVAKETIIPVQISARGFLFSVISLLSSDTIPASRRRLSSSHPNWK